MDRSTLIAKNTLLLYVRMLITLCVGLFTSRVILQTLGIEDYGVYDVVGGVVSLFSFMSGSLATAISRFITFSLGKGDNEKLKQVYSTSINIQVILGLVIVIVTELLGVWFLNQKMNIPPERMEAANWVIQCSIVICFIDLLKIPYNAVIIAHERMSAFAYISIIEVVLKLIVAYSLYISPYDKLKTYAMLLVLVSITIWAIYYIYCKIRFEECSYSFTRKGPLAKEMLSFAGWNLVGNGVYVVNTQGINMLSNIFFGVTVNAARGIANQVNGMMMQFVNNFTTAINPQITKSYAVGDFDYLFKLICKGAKYSYFLMLLFLVPLMFEIELVLDLWLGKYPTLAPAFLRLLIIGQMIDFLGNTMARTVWATGKVRSYYVITGFIAALVFPVSYVLFRLGFSALWPFIVFIVVYLVLIPVRLSIVKRLVGFPPSVFYKDVVFVVLRVTIISFIIPTLLYFFLDNSIGVKVLIIALSIVSVLLSVYFFGVDSGERKVLLSKLSSMLRR